MCINYIDSPINNPESDIDLFIQRNPLLIALIDTNFGRSFATSHISEHIQILVQSLQCSFPALTCTTYARQQYGYVAAIMHCNTSEINMK